MLGPRIYTAQTLPSPIDSPEHSHEIDLDNQAAVHLLRVLRMTNGDSLRLFNGDGCEYQAELLVQSKKSASARIVSILKTDATMPLKLHLGQVISKGDRMDFTVQKATELGVSEITPLWSERCDVRRKADLMEKKLEHWRKVAISACEQSGRNTVPVIHSPMSLQDWLPAVNSDRRLLLHPHNQRPLESAKKPESVTLLVGPEGGFSDLEVGLCQAQQFDGLLLGPRILRTETAALTAISVLQYVWGDFR